MFSNPCLWNLWLPLDWQYIAVGVVSEPAAVVAVVVVGVVVVGGVVVVVVVVVGGTPPTVICAHCTGALLSLNFFFRKKTPTQLKTAIGGQGEGDSNRLTPKKHSPPP